jgi:hypothetical protein
MKKGVEKNWWDFDTMAERIAHEKRIPKWLVIAWDCAFRYPAEWVVGFERWIWRRGIRRFFTPAHRLSKRIHSWRPMPKIRI